MFMQAITFLFSAGVTRVEFNNLGIDVYTSTKRVTYDTIEDFEAFVERVREKQAKYNKAV